MNKLQVDHKHATISYDCLKDIGNDWEFFFKNKKPNELLGIGSIDTDFIFWNITPIPFYKKYFESGRFIEPEICISNKEKDFHFFQSHFELFPKLVWLLDDFFKENQFKNPVGLLYNPALDSYEIHPGGSRQIVYKILKPKRIKGLIFTPKRPWLKKEDFEITFESEEQIKDYFSGVDLQVGITPDKGTLIPHIHFNMGDIEKNALHYHNKINKVLDSTYFHFPQFESSWTLYLNSPNKPNRVEIVLDDEVKNNEIYQLVALAAACLEKSIELDNIQIKYFRNDFT